MYQPAHDEEYLMSGWLMRIISHVIDGPAQQFIQIGD